MKKQAKNLLIWLIIVFLIAAPLNRATAEEDPDLKAATASCEKASRIAANYGFLADLDPQDKLWNLIKESGILDKSWNFLRSNFNIPGLNINLNELKEQIGLGGVNIDFRNIQNTISSFFQSRFGSQIQSRADQIVKNATKSILDKFGLGDISSLVDNLTSGVLSTEVPVLDKETIKEIRRSQQAIVAEQKRQETIKRVRSECDDLLKTTTETIKRTILFQLSTQIVDWIQTGREPQFIKQPGRFLEDTGRLALDRFISRAIPQLCQPLRLSLQIQVPSTDPTANPFYEQITCTLDQVVDNIENFYQDFSSGGWIAYNEIWKPQNNPFGAALMINDQIIFETARAVENAKRNQEKGFTGQTRCTTWKKYEFIGDENAGGLDVIYINGIGYFVRTNESPPGDRDKLGEEPEQGLTSRQPQTGPITVGTRWWKNADYFWQCEETEITNPATVAAALSERAAQTDFDFISVTSDIEPFIQTIRDSIINKLVKSGVKGLKGILQRLQ